MARLMILAEGPTEREFIDRVLAPHLQGFGVWVANPPDMGGNVSVQRLARQVRALMPNYDHTTTLVDYYGFKDTDHDRWDGPERLEALILGELGHPENFTPYVQMHEFEALLFACPRSIADALRQPAAGASLAAIRNGFESPEAINDSPETAPSKRLEAVFGRAYDKVLHGSVIAEAIGLAGIRAECPRFHRWLSDLERLGGGG